MTQVPVAHQGGEVQQWAGYDGATGLEDMTTTDQVIPRIKIVHDKGYWEDNLTQTPMSTLYFIALGLVKQRVLFHPNVEDNDVPMCKSSDFVTGFPNPEAPKEKSFPWPLAGFDPNDFAPIDSEGVQRALPCAGCHLKDWGSHPTSTTPYCAEQWTLPIFFDAANQPEGAFDIAAAEWTPAILTLQKSSIKPIKSYLSSFKGANKPPFLNICKGTLKLGTRGQVTYSTPNFTKGPESPRERWNEFAESYVEMKAYLQRPPVRDEDGADTAAPSDNSYAGPAQPVAQQPVVQQQPQVVQGTVEPQPAQPVAQQPVPAQDPWTGEPVAQPAAAAPAQPVAQPAPVQPVQPVAPVQPVQPVAQPVAQSEPTPAPAQPEPVAAAPAQSVAQPEAPKPAGTALPF